jgi:diguanylate cyclase (GGDEF)-like protein
MAIPKPIAPSFALKVLAPSVAAVSGIAMLLLYIVNGIFEETNRLDSAYSEKLTAAAVDSLRTSLDQIIYDNAVWDDAADHAAGKVDAGWIDGTWGYSSALDVYDTVFVVDPDGTTLYAAQNGAHDTGLSADAYLGPELDAMMEQAAHRSGEHAAVSGIVLTDGQPSVVSMAEITYADEAKASTAKSGNLLIFAKTLDEAMLQGLAKRYVVDALNFSHEALSPKDGVISITAPSGAVIGSLTWKNRSPGDVVRQKYGYVVTMTVVMFLFLIAVLLYMSWKGARDANDSRAKAVAASLRDDLTGLANRRKMLLELSAAVAHAKANKGCLSLIYADLDGFKEVNDSYGHEIGDMLLRAAAAGFAFLGKDAGVIARLGGDEFAMMFTGPESSERSRAVAERMISFFEEPMIFDGRVTSVSVSAGIVDLEDDDTDVEEIIRRADVAMYKAKSEGRNRANVYHKSFDFKRDENRHIASQLREHIEKGNLTVVYQPIVDARTRRVKGVEALVRWPKDAPKRYTPDVFIPVAEEFGLIEDLGLFVLREACAQAAQWDDIFVAVNVSPLQFLNPSFGDLVEQTLEQTGLDPKRLEVEVTEGFIIDNAARANAIIGRLHEMHVRVALDDFGTGFSSIGHLRRFKFDKLKLDRSMVTDILRQPSALRLVQGTIAMADALGLTVLAEGIEDENQVSVLRLAGCSQFQGFLFSKPVEAHEITEFIESRLEALAG